MASSSTPYGVQVISDQGGPDPRTQRITLGIANQFGSNIFKGQPVKANPATGTIVPVTAVTDKIIGIFEGCEYTPLGGAPTGSPFWPGGTVFDPNYDMFAYIYPAWLTGVRWLIQADGSITYPGLFGQFNFTLANLGNGNTITGLSSCTLSATPVSAGSQGQVAMVEFGEDLGSQPGDAFTDVICIIANGQIGPAPQTSIG